MKLFSTFFSKKIILTATKAFLQPRSIPLCKVYNVPGVHLTSEWNNLKNGIKLTRASYIFKYIFASLCFLNFSLDNNCNFYLIVIANVLF